MVIAVRQPVSPWLDRPGPWKAQNGHCRYCTGHALQRAGPLSPCGHDQRCLPPSPSSPFDYTDLPGQPNAKIPSNAAATQHHPRLNGSGHLSRPRDRRQHQRKGSASRPPSPQTCPASPTPVLCSPHVATHAQCSCDATLRRSGLSSTHCQRTRRRPSLRTDDPALTIDCPCMANAAATKRASARASCVTPSWVVGPRKTFPAHWPREAPRWQIHTSRNTRASLCSACTANGSKKASAACMP